MRIVDDVNSEIQIQRLPGELCPRESQAGRWGAEAKDDENEEEKKGKELQEQQLKEYIFRHLYMYVVCGSVVSRFSVSVRSPLSLPHPSPSHTHSHFIVFGLWLHTKFISMTLGRRRRWSSSSASQLPREPRGAVTHPPSAALIPAQYKFVCDADSIIDLGFDLTRTITTTTTITITITLSL